MTRSNWPRLSALVAVATWIAATASWAEPVSKGSRKMTDGTLSEHRLDAPRYPAALRGAPTHPDPAAMHMQPQMPPGVQPPMPEPPMPSPPAYTSLQQPANSSPPPAPAPVPQPDPSQPEPENSDAAPATYSPPRPGGEKPEMYVYRDDGGTINFTNRSEKIPARYRGKVKPYPITVDEEAPAP